MKKVVLFFLALALASCSNNKPVAIDSTIYVEKKLSEFIADHPDWTTNETTEAEITDQFKHKLINLSNEPDFLVNMPLQLKEIKDTLVNDQHLKIATFKAFNDKKRGGNSLLNFMLLQISGIVSDQQAADLQPNKNYSLTGTLYKQGKRADVKFIHVTDFKGYDLGKYTFLITGFKPL